MRCAMVIASFVSALKKIRFFRVPDRGSVNPSPLGLSIDRIFRQVRRLGGGFRPARPSETGRTRSPASRADRFVAYSSIRQDGQSHGRPTQRLAASIGRIGRITALFAEIEPPVVEFERCPQDRTPWIAGTSPGISRDPHATVVPGAFSTQKCRPLRPTGASDTAPGVRPASRPCVSPGLSFGTTLVNEIIWLGQQRRAYGTTFL